MILATYIKEKMGERSYREMERATEETAGTRIGKSTLQQLVTSTTSEPKPKTLAVLAKTFAEGDKIKTTRYYAEMMTLANYLDLLPNAQVAVESPFVKEREVLDRLNPTLREFADGLRDRSLKDYWEFLRGIEAQESESKLRNSRQ